MSETREGQASYKNSKCKHRVGFPSHVHLRHSDSGDKLSPFEGATCESLGETSFTANRISVVLQLKRLPVMKTVTAAGPPSKCCTPLEISPGVTQQDGTPRTALVTGSFPSRLQFSCFCFLESGQVQPVGTWEGPLPGNK